MAPKKKEIKHKRNKKKEKNSNSGDWGATKGNLFLELFADLVSFLSQRNTQLPNSRLEGMRMVHGPTQILSVSTHPVHHLM
jgi:hypothetical protein